MITRGVGDASAGLTRATNAILSFFKDLTRTTWGLLASESVQESWMVKPKTHFEQVPLDIVKQIVEKQSDLTVTEADVPLPRKKAKAFEKRR